MEEPHYLNNAFASCLREESETRTRLRNCQSGTDQWCLQSSTRLPAEAKLGCFRGKSSIVSQFQEQRNTSSVCSCWDSYRTVAGQTGYL